MKAKTKFLKMYYKLPLQARDELVYDFLFNPMTLKVCKAEIENDTENAEDILKRLGYIDD